jgi:hypothetical protein
MPFRSSDDVVLPAGKGPFYVPTDLADAHRELLRLLRPEDLERIRSGTEANMVRYHRGLGAWLRHHWGFFRGSRLADHLRSLGLFHPDDMSGLVLDTFWRSLHGLPLGVSERVAQAQDYWRAMQKPAGGSPRDGARIEWVITRSPGPGAVHLGISVSDASYWRYAHGDSGQIEPAWPEDKKSLDELRQTWRELGTTPDWLSSRPGPAV